MSTPAARSIATSGSPTCSASWTRAVAARRLGSLTFVAFDLLWADDRFLIDETYERRRARLASLDLGRAATVVPSWDGMTAPYLFAACEEHGVEGIVLKRRTSTYRPGERSHDWRKLKTRQVRATRAAPWASMPARFQSTPAGA